MVHELGKLLKENALKTDPKALPKLRNDFTASLDNQISPRVYMNAKEEIY